MSTRAGRRTTRLRALSALAMALAPQVALGQTTTSSESEPGITAKTTFKLAANYKGDSFFSQFNFFDDADPTNGYVNYVSQSTAESEGYATVQSDGSFVMRANSESVASAPGRDSVRISSKDEFADGVYILDLNHMPVGCGTWPAFWTVVENGWPSGGEIDVIEGANGLPSAYSTAWNATGNLSATSVPSTSSLRRDAVSLHTSDNCQLTNGAYMSGTLGSTVCDAYLNDNQGCGVELGGNSTYGTDSFGAGVNEAGGGWYAMWRDIQGSGGVYVYFWPRNSAGVPDDVKNADTTETNLIGWGQPGANLSVSSCRSDFGNHVIVFNIDFCGDYSAATWSQSGCPTTSTCASFVQNNPLAFSETYWSINSLRVYTVSGKPAGSSGLATGAIIGIVLGCAAFVALLCGLLVWRWRVARSRRAALAEEDEEDEEMSATKPLGWVAPDEVGRPAIGVGNSVTVYKEVPLDDRPKKKHRFRRKSKEKKRTKDKKAAPRLATARPRTGRTSLAPGKTVNSILAGETHDGYYHEVYEHPSAPSPFQHAPSQCYSGYTTPDNRSVQSLDQPSQPTAATPRPSMHSALLGYSTPRGGKKERSLSIASAAALPSGPVQIKRSVGNYSRKSSLKTSERELERESVAAPPGPPRREKPGRANRMNSSQADSIYSTHKGQTTSVYSTNRSRVNSVYSTHKYSAAVTEGERRGSSFQGSRAGNSWVG